MAELRRIKREVEAGGFDVNTWYRDMTEVCWLQSFFWKNYQNIF